MNTQLINSNTIVIAGKAAYKWFSNLPVSSQADLVRIGIFFAIVTVVQFTESKYSFSMSEGTIILAPQPSVQV